MKINFLTFNPNEKSGSYRIWVRDLSLTLNEIEYDSKIFTSIKELILEKDTDVIILCKSAYVAASEVRKHFLKAKIGAINIPCNHIDETIDFVIVGSPEEYTSMSNYRNVFIYPLIERKFESVKRKIHESDNNVLKLCFHGHYPHLFKFQPFLKEAIEYVDQNIKKVSLSVITGNPKYEWQSRAGRPNVEINMFPYDENITERIQECDIGLAPNVSDIRPFVEGIENLVRTDWGLYNTDYFLRFKNKTNPGRAYVFYQHGIPVIHDISPSSFELMKITGYNVCAHDKLSWVREIEYLSKYKNREKISLAYYESFKKYYDVHVLAKKITKKINEV